MSRIRAAATARLAAVEQAGDVLRANLDGTPVAPDAGCSRCMEVTIFLVPS